MYVLGTNEQDWQKLLNFLRASTYSIKFFLAGEQQPIPEKIEQVFALVHTYGGMAHIDEEHLALHCYFYTYEEIEFDLDPRKINSEQQIRRLLDFMQAIGETLGKEIILTPENMSRKSLLRFNSHMDEKKWSLDGITKE